jgi:hypothetical protein
MGTELFPLGVVGQGVKITVGLVELLANAQGPGRTGKQQAQGEHKKHSPTQPGNAALTQCAPVRDENRI